MKTSDLLYNNNIDSVIRAESILKLLLCYYNNIKENLNKIPNMERRELNYIDEYIQDSITQYKESTNKNGIKIRHHKDVSVSKHFIITDIVKSNGSYVKLNNYVYPEYLRDNLHHSLDGPYLSSKYIIFYDEIKKIVMVFTCSNIKSNNGQVSDFSLRELNSYILDNFYRSDFDDFISGRVTHTLDYKKDILSHNTMSLKIGNHDNNPTILRLIKENIYSGNNIDIHPFYKWEIIQPYYVL